MMNNFKLYRLLGFSSLICIVVVFTEINIKDFYQHPLELTGSIAFFLGYLMMPFAVVALLYKLNLVEKVFLLLLFVFFYAVMLYLVFDRVYVSHDGFIWFAFWYICFPVLLAAFVFCWVFYKFKKISGEKK